MPAPWFAPPFASSVDSDDSPLCRQIHEITRRDSPAGRRPCSWSSSMFSSSSFPPSSLPTFSSSCLPRDRGRHTTERRNPRVHESRHQWADHWTVSRGHSWQPCTWRWRICSRVQFCRFGLESVSPHAVLERCRCANQSYGSSSGEHDEGCQVRCDTVPGEVSS